MAYQVQIDNFEGPLDLLLHLVQREEMDIYQVPIARITQQYLETLGNLQDLDLETASEFLVIAATLLQIKARMLFPRPKAAPLEPTDLGEADPRQELIDRLLVYSRFKLAAQWLGEREAGRAGYFTRWAEVPEAAQPSDPLGALSLVDLLAALQRAMERKEPDAWREIPREQVTLREKMAAVLVAIRSRPEGVSFRALLGPAPRRLEIVVAFLAVLELLRLQQVTIRQGAPFSELLITASPERKSEAMEEESE